MQKIRKAVIPAAGLGTRVLPATKAMPKEMLPIVDKPAIQYIVEEAVAAGIEEILIITGRGKGIMEDHFDRAPELEAGLAKPGKEKMLERRALHRRTWRTSFICARKRQRGWATPCLKARPFAAGRTLRRSVRRRRHHGRGPCRPRSSAALTRSTERPAWASRRSRPPISCKYSSMKLEPSVGQPVQHHRHDREARARTGIQPVLHPRDAACLHRRSTASSRTPQPGAGGEIQLTDAMRRAGRAPEA